ncbi:MAG: hypothetical protein ACO1RA_08510 [Planctomycetaceae bacterium]
MSERHNHRDSEAPLPGINPGYAAMQLAKALTTCEVHDDLETRKRAEAKIARWESVLRDLLSGTVAYGSRTPVDGAPAWATLEVVTGGFATGSLLAGGVIQPHEQLLLNSLPTVKNGDERRALNAYFLSEAGLAQLQQWLRSGCYDINVPEEGALLVVAWLVEKGFHKEARELIEKIASHFADLRFYPIPLEKARHFGSRLHVQDVRQTIGDLNRIRPNKRVLAQKEAVEVWAPFLDQMVSLLLETVEDSWPCRRYPADWSQRVHSLEASLVELRKKHKLCGIPYRTKGHFSQLRILLGKSAESPDALTPREVGRIRLILIRYLEKRGRPDSPQCIAQRQRQKTDVKAPLFHDVGKVVLSRLQSNSPGEGIDEIGDVVMPVTAEESLKTTIPIGVEIPASIQRKVERCLNEMVGVLVEKGLISSGESLARVLPQLTSGTRSAGISDPLLRQLYSAIYRAFRRRRSLLLLNLEKQVQIEELPWIAAIENFREESLSTRELAKQALEEVSHLAITSFPHAMLPNKLLQELRALAQTADLKIPLVDEVAADIFMGRFSSKYVASAKVAADLLEGSLYATYYGIDYRPIRSFPSEEKDIPNWSGSSKTSDPFSELCLSRAGVPVGARNVAMNGMVIEQQQIVTTQNLATLFVNLNLSDSIRDQLGQMATQCFKWICRRLQAKTDQWHARLIAVKNSAYAWRQMIFYLSLIPEQDAQQWVVSAENHLGNQPEQFANRFRPAIEGLKLALDGRPPDSSPSAKQFLGWSNTRHWLLEKE